MLLLVHLWPAGLIVAAVLLTLWFRHAALALAPHSPVARAGHALAVVGIVSSVAALALSVFGCSEMYSRTAVPGLPMASPLLRTVFLPSGDEEPVRFHVLPSVGATEDRMATAREFAREILTRAHQDDSSVRLSRSGSARIKLSGYYKSWTVVVVLMFDDLLSADPTAGAISIEVGSIHGPQDWDDLQNYDGDAKRTADDFIRRMREAAEELQETEHYYTRVRLDV